MADNCEGCAFSHGEPSRWDGTIRCRRYPPTEQPNDDTRRKSFLAVHRHDWCGEFKPKEQDNDQ